MESFILIYYKFIEYNKKDTYIFLYTIFDLYYGYLFYWIFPIDRIYEALIIIFHAQNLMIKFKIKSNLF